MSTLHLPIAAADERFRWPRPRATEVVSDLRPPLKWAGGKRWQVPILRPLWERHAHRRLVEPFCGGLAVALGLLPEKALLNDANPHLVNFYQYLKRGLFIDLQMENDEDLFYGHRARFNRLLVEGKDDTREAASLFYYLNRTGYNGLCRFNQSGQFNVPFGQHGRIGYQRDFTPYRAQFADWRLTAGDFRRVPLRPGDFVYADPPYDVEFTEYFKGGFSWQDQVETAELLAQHEGPVVLSNQATKRVVKLYEDLGYELHFLKAPRRISCSGDRTPAREVLALRNF